MKEYEVLKNYSKYSRPKEYRSYEEQERHEKAIREALAWVEWAKGKGFSLFGTYTFGWNISEREAVKKFKRFYQRQAQRLKQHLFSFYGRGKQNKRKWSDGQLHNGWHFHSADKYEKSKAGILTKKAPQWEHGDSKILPFDSEAGAFAYTASHKSGGIWLTSCPKVAKCCRRGDCYWNQQLCSDGILAQSEANIIS